MANSYTYQIKLRDLVTAQLSRAKTAASEYHQKMIAAGQATQKASSQSATSITQLNQKLSILRNKRDNAFSTKQIGIYNRSISQTEKQLQKLNNLPSPGILGRFRQMGSKMGSLIGMAGGLAVAMAAIGAVGGIIKLGSELEQTRISFQTMMQSVDAGNKMITDLTALGAATPFGNRELQENAKLLLNFGIAGKKVIPTLKMLGDVSGGNVERLNGLTLAYSQVTSAGKLQGQDLMQMINAGFNPLNEIAKITGESLGSLKDKMSAGGISAKMVDLAFQSATSKGGMFNNMMQKQSQTLGGKWSTFLDTVMDKMAQFGERLAPYLSSIIGFATTILEGLFAIPDALSNMWKWLKNNMAIIAPLGVAVLALTAGFWAGQLSIVAFGIATKAQALYTGIITGVTWLWTAAQWAVNVAMTANPIGLVIAAIALLVGAVVWVVKHWDWFVAKWKLGWTLVGNFVKMNWIIIKTAFFLIVNNIQILYYKFKGFGQWIGGFFHNIGKAIKLALNFDFSGAKKALTAPIKVAADGEVARLEKERKKVVGNAEKQIKSLAIQSAKAAIELTGIGKKTEVAKKKQKIESKGVQKVKSSSELKAEMEAELSGSSGSGKGKSKTGAGSKSGDKSNEIITSGKRSMVYNIQIDSVIKDIKQYVSNGKESADELVDEILDQLTRRLSGTFKSATE